MINFLFRFSVLNTAFSVIGQEIRDKICMPGENVQIALLFWTIVYGLFQLMSGPTSGLHLDTTCAGLFMLSTGYSRFVTQIAPKSRILSFADWPCLRSTAHYITQVTLPFVFWFFVWSPLHGGMALFLHSITGTDNTMYSSATAVTLLLVIFGLFRYVFPRMTTKTDGSDQTSNAKMVVTPIRRRPPSARIRARRMSKSAD